MDLYSNEPELAQWATLEPARQRQLGQFWTPYPVARLMAAWLAPTSGPILDPAAGSGVFCRALADPRRPIASSRAVESYDLDPAMVDFLRGLLAQLPLRASALEANFFDLPAGPRYGGIITNPPYLNHLEMERDVKRALRAQLVAETGLAVPGQANLYAYFLVRLPSMLAAGGRMAAIVPSEFLDSSFARPIKRHYLERGLLRGVVSFSAAQSIFAGAMTTAAILLLAREERTPPPAAFLRLGELAELEGYEEQLACADSELRFGRRYAPAELDAERAWRGYLDGDAPVVGPGHVTLGSLAVARHGITTGHNEFFVLSRSALGKAGLKLADCQPTVPRSSVVPASTFSQADLDALDALDARVWLVSLTDEPDAAGRAYLDSPLGQDARRRPSLRGRQPWWRQPRPQPAPLWVSNLSRGRVKVVRNSSAALPLDQFHSLYPRASAAAELAAGAAGVARLTALLGAYLRSSSFAAALRAGCREYGQGLLKMETRELLALPVPDFARLPATLLDELAAGDADPSRIDRAVAAIERHLAAAQLPAAA